MIVSLSYPLPAAFCISFNPKAPAASSEMPSPKNLPGFYFDPEKNRYFPTKGPIPGTKRPSSSSNPSSDALSSEHSDPSEKQHIKKQCRRNHVKASEMLLLRELHGRFLISNKYRYDFEHEYQKLQASRPMMWKYTLTTGVSDSALEHMYGIVQTPAGLKGTKFLTLGSTNGAISLYEFGNTGEYFYCGLKCIVKPVWPPSIIHNISANNLPRNIWSSTQASTWYSSNISHIQRVGKLSPAPVDGCSSSQNALVATLGSGESGGSVYILNLREPLDFSPGAPSLDRRMSKLASSECTIWSADCNNDGTQAVIGTDTGAALVNLETGVLSWVYRTKSDIFSEQFDHSGNIVLCGFRSGAIIPVDVRQKQSGSSVLPARPTPTMPTVRRRFHASTLRHDKRCTKQKFKAVGDLNSSGAHFMSSSVCSLVALQSDDQYFIGSSMDGSLKLFDLRLLSKGAVQSYEGHVNSHTHLQLGVDPSEKLVISGGEDRFVRIWSIKTGELIFGENIANTVLPIVCWPQIGNASFGTDGGLYRSDYERDYEPTTHSWGVWFGSREGLYYMNGT